MKKTFLILALVTTAISFAVVACTNTEAKQAEGKEEVALSQDSLIKRGSYLVNAVGCDDCHSPMQHGPNGPELIMERRFGGHPSDFPTGGTNKDALKDGWVLFSFTSAIGPWGQSYAANISSDETGIGNWTEEQFFRAIREGKSKGLKEARPLLPPMPWFVYKNFSDTDIKAIFAFLKSTKPVRNVVPGPKAPNEL
ncbi:MAG: diheme cytochrome c-553 [Chitinophagaceae bacterium]|nr:diheme cytochrome c-553 [Chitinophagaceae bacterium]